MRQAISTALWITIYLTPIAVVYYTVKSFTLEYDENIAAFIYALKKM